MAAVTRTLTRTLIETLLKAEPNDHLGHAEGDVAGAGSGNSRNGVCGAAVLPMPEPGRTWIMAKREALDSRFPVRQAD